MAKTNRLKTIASALSFAAALAAMGGSAFADTPNTPITVVGQQTGFGYIRYAGMPACGGYPMYIDSHIDSSTDGQSRVMAQILAAYLAGKKIANLNYTVVNNLCYLTIIEF